MKNLIVGILIGSALTASVLYADVVRTPFGTRFGDDGKSGYPQVIVPVPGETVVPAFPRTGRPC